MGKVNLEYVKPGMRLASDVRHISGQVLLLAGTEITERHLSIFQTWGIAEADVEGFSQDEIESAALSQFDPECLAAVQAHVSELFCRADLEHPMTRELFRLCVARQVRLQTGGKNHD